MKVRIREGSIVKEHKTGGTYVWHERDKLFEIIDKGSAVIEAEGYEGERNLSTNWDNLVVVEE